jgi:hypothetical protein
MTFYTGQFHILVLLNSTYNFNLYIKREVDLPRNHILLRDWKVGFSLYLSVKMNRMFLLKCKHLQMYFTEMEKHQPERLVLQLSMQSVPIATKVVSSKPTHGEMYSIQYYVIKYVSDLRQVGAFPFQ